MKKDFSISLMPLASFADTDYGPIISAWKDAGQHITDYPFSGPGTGTWDVSLDVSGVVDVLEAASDIGNRDGHDRFDEHALRWVETGELARLTISVEAPVQAFGSEQAEAATLTALVQELYLVLNMCAAGAGHFNGAVCQESRLARVSYFGDPFESAWALAYEWNWPPLRSLSFVESWKWLERIGFRNCSIAENAVHRALVMLIEAGVEFSSSEPLETLLLARALESVIGGGGRSVGSALKERIGLILGIPQCHKGWLNDFYGLRSRVAHGDYPLIREGVATEQQVSDYSQKFWVPLDRARAVVLALLQDLVTNGSTGYHFEERVHYD